MKWCSSNAWVFLIRFATQNILLPAMQSVMSHSFWRTKSVFEMSATKHSQSVPLISPDHLCAGLQLSLVVLILFAYIELVCLCMRAGVVGGWNQTVVGVGLWLWSVTWFCYVLGVVLTLGLLCIHHNKREHIPYIDCKIKDISEKDLKKYIEIVTLSLIGSPSLHFSANSFLNFMGMKFWVRCSLSMFFTQFRGMMNIHAEHFQHIPLINHWTCWTCMFFFLTWAMIVQFYNFVFLWKLGMCFTFSYH